jgi:hypothetical protein
MQSLPGRTPRLARFVSEIKRQFALLSDARNRDLFAEILCRGEPRIRDEATAREAFGIPPGRRICTRRDERRVALDPSASSPIGPREEAVARRLRVNGADLLRRHMRDAVAEALDNEIAKPLAHMIEEARLSLGALLAPQQMYDWSDDARALINNVKALENFLPPGAEMTSERFGVELVCGTLGPPWVIVTHRPTDEGHAQSSEGVIVPPAGVYLSSASKFEGPAYRPAAWFKAKTKIKINTLHAAAAAARKSKRVRKKVVDGVPLFSVEDARRWWPAAFRDA